MPTPEFDYATWSEFRYQIRRYIRTAEAAARAHGLEPQQHQLLLAVRGLPEGHSPTIAVLAERLQLRHHSTVELVDRMESAGLVVRRPTGVGRAVEVKLTPRGLRSLDAVSVNLRSELAESGRELIASLSKLVRTDAAPARGAARSAKAEPAAGRSSDAAGIPAAPRKRKPSLTRA
ncbi:MAG: helix-turn-helix domain-containing protein [Chloroflexi bacterium]|nr:helix-turn-helix domain-containing protein [Chloroflexota bacterium]